MRYTSTVLATITQSARGVSTVLIWIPVQNEADRPKMDENVLVTNGSGIDVMNYYGDFPTGVQFWARPILP